MHTHTRARARAHARTVTQRVWSDVGGRAYLSWRPVVSCKMHEASALRAPHVPHELPASKEPTAETSKTAGPAPTFYLSTAKLVPGCVEMGV